MEHIQKSSVRDEQLNTLAHDLRNVISVVYLNIQALELRLSKLDMKKETEIATEIKSEIQKMNLLISERMESLGVESKS